MTEESPGKEAQTRKERKYKQHQLALEKIVRPDHIQANTEIYSHLRSGELTIDEAEHRSEELLVKVASVDHMTGLDNARAADLKLTQLIEYCEQMDISLVGLYLDGDEFREVNKLGHDLGDLVIKALGQAIGVVRTTDLQSRLTTEHTTSAQGPEDEKTGTQARLGGDEFFVVLPGATLEDTEDIFSRITAAFATITDNAVPEFREKFGRSITITGGAAQYVGGRDNGPQGFINTCERAMQKGKDTQKGSLTIVNLPAPNTNGSNPII